MFRAIERDADRNRPALIAIGGAGEVPPLGQREPRLADAIAGEIERDLRHPGLLEPAGCQCSERTTGTIQRGEQVRSRRVTVRVCRDVLPDRGLECGLAELVLEHPQHGSTLGIGDLVERVLDVTCRCDRLVNLARAHELVGAKRALAVADCLQRPLRVERGEHLVLDPGREALVQPDVIPPLRRDEIAKPLMRRLVSDRRDQDVEVAGIRAIEHQVLRIARDHADVLHRAEHRGHEHDIELGIREWRAEPGLE